MGKDANLQPTKVIAKIFSCSTRRVEQLETKESSRGRASQPSMILLPTIQAYIHYLSDKANGREKRETLADLEEAKLRAEVDLKEAKASAAQMELKELQGKMHRAEDVEAITTDHVLFFRSMLMAMPGKLAVDVSNLRTAAEISERIKQECYFILESLADYRYDPEEYKKRVMERQGWENHEEE